MNAVPCLLILTFCHFFADFIIQDRRVQSRDTASYVLLGKHLVQLFCTFVFVSMVTLNFGVPMFNAVKFVIINLLVHALIDVVSSKIFNAVVIERPLIEDEHITDRQAFWISLAVDQYLHVATIIVLWGMYLQ